LKPAFFPGGLALLLDESDEPHSDTADVMAVGQDFNTVATHDLAR
jgi:hypothetical protein